LSPALYQAARLARLDALGLWIPRLVYTIPTAVRQLSTTHRTFSVKCAVPWIVDTRK